MFNLLQFLPNAWWVTRQGVQAGRYPEFGPARAPQAEAAPPDSNEWARATELAAEPLHPAMRQWAAAHLLALEVGFELTDGKGQVLAEAELAWPAQRVAVLHGEQSEKEAAFEQAGWRAYLAEDDVAGRVINGWWPSGSCSNSK